MATSGSFVTTSYEGRSLTFSWNRTAVDIANNRSTIAWSVKGSGSYTAGWVTCGDIDVVVNGTTVYNSSADNRVNVWSGTVVASGTSVINHNADGSKSFSASVNAAVYNYAQNVSGSGTFAIDAIPRSSSIDKVANTSGTSISSLNTSNALRVYFTPKSTAFKYRVTVSMNGNSYQNDTSGVSVSSTAQTYYQPAAIPHSWIPNSTSGTLTCKLETLNGTTVIGTSTKTITMNVPSSVVPTISTFSSIPYNTNSTISSWNIYVANYSKARLSCTAAGNSGSTITKFQISGAISETVDGTSLSNYNVNLTSGGTKTFNIVAIDSRGRSSASKSVTINVSTYYTPSISSFDVIRTDASGNASENGTAAKLSFTGNYSNIGSNASTAKFSYKLSTASTYTTISTTVTGTNGSVNGGIIVSNVTFSTASEYDFQIQISDSLGNSVSRTVRLGTVTRTMNIAKFGNGVAIGKMSTVSSQTAAGKFEVGWDTDFDENVNIDGKLTLTGGLSTPLSIANGGSGASTANGMALSHKHLYMHQMSGESGVSGYIKFATIKISGTYTDSPIEIKMVRRGDFATTTAFILLSNANSSDPSVNTIYSYGPVNVWINKSATSTFDLYAWKNGSYDNMSILDLKYSAYMNDRISVTFSNTNVTSVPSTAIMSTRLDADSIIEDGSQGEWQYRKWSDGRAECWRIVSVNPANLNNGVNTISMDLPFTFASSNYSVQITPAKAGHYISGVADCNASGTVTHSTTAFTICYRYNYSTAYTVNFNIAINGRWK